MALVIGIFLELLQVIFMNHYRHKYFKWNPIYSL